MAPVENVVGAFLEYLVDPVLPMKSTFHQHPSLSQQQSVAKQIHAVVLLYNYYQRKQHPEMEFLDFESFCKLAVTLRPTLMAHMKLIQQSDHTGDVELENDFSLTEKAITDACNISLVLDASKDVPNMEGWPISKVAVLLIDSTKEHCVLNFSSITKGVWSVIEKDIDLSTVNSDSSSDGKHTRKRKRARKKPLHDEQDGEDTGIQQLAFAVIKEATGIRQSDLMVLESHVVYSLSKEKTVAHFYIMQCTQSSNHDLQVPIKDVIESLGGPLVKKSSHNWTVTQVVEYYHLLPYARIMSDWLSRELSSSSMQDIKVESENIDNLFPAKSENSCEIEVTERREMALYGLQNSSVERENANENSYQRTESCCDKEGSENRDNSDRNGKITDFGDNKGSNFNSFQRTDEPGDDETTVKMDKSGNSTDCGDNKGNNFSSFQRTDEPGDDETTVKVDKSGNSTDFGDNKASNAISFQRTDEPGDDETILKIDKSVSSCKIANSRGNEESPKPREDNRRFIACFTNSSSPPKSMDKNHSTEKSKNNCMAIRVYHHQKRRSSTRTDINAARTHVKDEMKSQIPNSRNEKVATENKSRTNISSDQNGTLMRDLAVVPFRMNGGHVEKLQRVLATKETAISHTALRALLKKREKLAYRIRLLEDEMALCNQRIQTITDGGEDDLALKIDAIMDFCNDACLKCNCQNHERPCQHFGDQGSSPCMKRKRRLSEAILTVRTPCQELDDICRENIWLLPTYRVTPSDDGRFLAKVTLKGTDFEYSTESDLLSSPHEARESAAENMIFKLRSATCLLQ